jgi:hypothetical protein
MISCKQCQKHVMGYIQRDLEPQLNWQVSQHIHQCENCYAVYQEEKRLLADLRRVVPKIGNDQPPAFERVWKATRAASVHRSTPQYSLRYGMAMLIVTFLLLIPFAIGKGNQVFAGPPTQPAPLIRITPNGTAATQEGVSVAFEIQQTPAPAHPPVTLPVDAISTP